MHVSEIWMTQRTLRPASQISGMVDALLDGGSLPPISLARLSDGSIRVVDGHHRLAAIRLAGRCRLQRHEYVLVESDRWRPRFGKIDDMLRRNGIFESV